MVNKLKLIELSNNQIFLHLLEGLFAMLILVSCGSVKQIPVETKTVYNYVDSVRYIQKDSIVLKEKSIYKEYASYADTLVLEAEGIAKAKAWNDDMCHMIQGILETEPQKTEYKIVYKDKIQYRDSLVYKEIPIEVEKEVRYVPSFYKWVLAYAIALSFIFVLLIYIKFRQR